MRRIAGLGLCIVVLASSGGCLCRCATDCYGDAIDEVSDHDCELDCLYCPAFDLTRIGFPDWCECPLNRALDCQRCACNLPYYGPRNRTLAAYYSTPYPSFQNSPTPAEQNVPPVPDENENLELPPSPAEGAGFERLVR